MTPSASSFSATCCIRVTRTIATHSLPWPRGARSAWHSSWCSCAATTTTAPATRRRQWGVHCVDEPFTLPAAPQLALCHHPKPIDRAYVLAGHLHPCTTVGRGIDRLRLPCFHFGASVGVLPAFGAFTGMHPIERTPGDRVFVVAEDRVVAIA